jgi:hypothetical protein
LQGRQCGRKSPGHQIQELFATGPARESLPSLNFSVLVCIYLLNLPVRVVMRIKKKDIWKNKKKYLFTYVTKHLGPAWKQRWSSLLVDEAALKLCVGPQSKSQPQPYWKMQTHHGLQMH